MAVVEAADEALAAVTTTAPHLEARNASRKGTASMNPALVLWPVTEFLIAPDKGEKRFYKG